jgi:ATP-dependent DNA ligase
MFFTTLPPNARAKLHKTSQPGWFPPMLATLTDERFSNPFDRDGLPRAGVHWVKPKLVARIGFTEWTGDGKLWHPRFLGLRDDKQAQEVRREK